MAIMLGALYKALLEAHVSPETARLAAEEVAHYQRRPAVTSDILALAFLWLGAAMMAIGGLIYLWRLI